MKLGLIVSSILIFSVIGCSTKPLEISVDEGPAKTGGGGGQPTADVRLAVDGFNAPPYNIASGDPVELSWSVPSGDRCVLYEGSTATPVNLTDSYLIAALNQAIYLTLRCFSGAFVIGEHTIVLIVIGQPPPPPVVAAQYVFTTSTKVLGNFQPGSNLAGADALCATRAQAGNFPPNLTWRAILSNKGVSANTRVSQTKEIRNANNQVVWPMGGLFVSAPLVAPNIDEMGNPIPTGDVVLTATGANGVSTTPLGTCNDWNSVVGKFLGPAYVGNPAAVGSSAWIANGTGSCGAGAHLYCLSD